MNEDVDLPYEEWLTACRNWDKFTGIPHPQHANWPTFSNGLEEFLGHNPWSVDYSKTKGSYACVSVPRHIIDRYKMLTGPHFMTLCKAWSLKRTLTSTEASNV